ncbi:MAG: hypothetical protein ACJ8AI_12420 [Rhodopila sp.]
MPIAGRGVIGMLSLAVDEVGQNQIAMHGGVPGSVGSARPFADHSQGNQPGQFAAQLANRLPAEIMRRTPVVVINTTSSPREPDLDQVRRICRLPL